MKIEVLKNETYEEVNNLPSKGTKRATGYDIVATSDPEIIGEQNVDGTYKRIDYIQYKTNLKMAVQKEQISQTGFSVDLTDYDVLAFPRSSVSKYNLQLANSIGLIDADYRGELLLRFNYLWQPQDLNVYTHDEYDENKKTSYIAGKPNLDKIYKKGDKICQLKVTKVESVEFVLVTELDVTERGDGGFGSTDVTKSEQTNKIKNEISNIKKLYSSLNNKINPPLKKYSEIVKERESVTDFTNLGPEIKKYSERVEESMKNFNSGEPIKKYSQTLEESKNMDIRNTVNKPSTENNINQ